MKCLNASILATAVFELLQQFYNATEIGNNSQCGQHLHSSAIAGNTKTIVSDEVHYRGAQS